MTVADAEGGKKKHEKGETRLRKSSIFRCMMTFSPETCQVKHIIQNKCSVIITRCNKIHNTKSNIRGEIALRMIAAHL